MIFIIQSTLVYISLESDWEKKKIQQIASSGHGDSRGKRGPMEGIRETPIFVLADASPVFGAGAGSTISEMREALP